MEINIVLFFFLQFSLAARETDEEVLKSPSLKERNQQANGLTRCTAVGSPVSNAEQQSQSVMPDPVIKPSQTQNKNINSDNVITHANDNSGSAPSLPRRKRVLPNLGSASRRRHSSVSKENVEKNLEVPEVRYEETVTTEEGLGHSSVSIVEFLEACMQQE